MSIRRQITVDQKQKELPSSENTKDKFTPFTPEELKAMGEGPEFNNLFDKDGNWIDDKHPVSGKLVHPN